MTYLGINLEWPYQSYVPCINGLIYCISGYFRGGFIFANFASPSSRKFPLQYKAIYSNENITKIAKLSTREFPQLVQNRKNIGFYSTRNPADGW